MKRLKADLSHRMRRRELSVFDAWWFRLVLGTGVAIVLGLAVGPPVAGWFRSELGPRGSGAVGSAPATPAPGAEDPERGHAGEVPARSDGSEGVPARSPDPPATPAVMGAPEPLPGAGARSVAGEGPVYRIQLGAFLDHRNADRLLARLREENLGAETSIVEQPRLVYRVVVEGP
ncbi:MAG TPA: SPOR domain-containing protein, partial [Methylomirabilota bacterium]|nr:SPOR domain-containing protein [Methylomirabilota bacterium]